MQPREIFEGKKEGTIIEINLWGYVSMKVGICLRKMYLEAENKDNLMLSQSKVIIPKFTKYPLSQASTQAVYKTQPPKFKVFNEKEPHPNLNLSINQNSEVLEPQPFQTFQFIEENRSINIGSNNMISISSAQTPTKLSNSSQKITTNKIYNHNNVLLGSNLDEMVIEESNKSTPNKITTSHSRKITVRFKDQPGINKTDYCCICSKYFF